MCHRLFVKKPNLFLVLTIFITASCVGEEPELTKPDERRFSKTALVTGELYEPIDMTILPNLDILIVQRRGEILKYDHVNSELTQVGFLDTYHHTDVEGVNAEEGVVGIEKDPNFSKNHFVYIYYSPADTTVNRLSRFKYEDNYLNMESEKIVLEVYSQRSICCHTGGRIAFDSNGLLYLTTGDNATPFNQPDQTYVLDGYAPLDGRPGFEQYDARRSSGNSNDLRGKVLRIKVNDDGTYDIPEGNLYPEGMEKTRPEIYIQGTRNPYSITIDPETGFLYWGDVGPDSRADSTWESNIGPKGPMGYDEINQAREAGNFGWPFFVGDNYAYNDYDYSSGETGSFFDPVKPVNRSPNNTGIEELPSAQPAFIWYPYTESEEFPKVESGGRNAMVGTIYYRKNYPLKTRMHGFYDKKLFIYDWVRNWIQVVTMNPEGDYLQMDPFIEHIDFNSIMDIELGPDGQLYILEYGSGWYSQNQDAGLSRIDFDDSESFTSYEKTVKEDNMETFEGHQQGDEQLTGQELIVSLNCSSCHLRSESSVGPSYERIAEHYHGDENAVPQMVESIMHGRTGVWGDRAMPPQANLSEEEAKKIVYWIQSLEGGEK
jgi:glucose/arabinose dehydrogenase/cytochrome c551/c552